MFGSVIVSHSGNAAKSVYLFMVETTPSKMELYTTNMPMCLHHAATERGIELFKLKIITETQVLDQ